MRSPFRIATAADAPRIFEIYAPIVSGTVISFETTPPTVFEIARRIERAVPRYPWLVFEDCEVIVGYAYAGPHRARDAYRWAVETSVYVDPARQRSGFGRALYARLLDMLERQGFTQALAGIVLPNSTSVSFHEAMGFVQVACYPAVGFKLGGWHDVGWWQRPLADPADPPVAPSPPSYMRRSVVTGAKPTASRT